MRKQREFPIMQELYRKQQNYITDKSILPKSSLGRAVNYDYKEAIGILHCPGMVHIPAE